jgi:hypothetical protein
MCCHISRTLSSSPVFIRVSQQSPSAGFCHVRLDHLRRIDDAVELVFRYRSQLKCGLLEREVVVHRVVRDLRRLVIADHGRESGHQSPAVSTASAISRPRPLELPVTNQTLGMKAYIPALATLAQRPSFGTTTDVWNLFAESSG